MNPAPGGAPSYQDLSLILELRIASVRPGKAASDDAFHDQMIGGARGADAYSKVELPLRAEINVDCWNELLLLIFERIKAIQ